MFSKVIVNSPWYFIALSLLVAACISLWLYYRNKKNDEAPRKILIGMALIRFISVSLVTLLILNIFFKSLQNETENPVILIALDNSSSMTGGSDSLFVKNEFQNSLNTLKKNLEDKFNVKTLVFGSSVQAGVAADFKQKETDLDQLIREVDNNYSNQNIGALVIASDGIYNKGANPVYASEKLNFPVFTVALGDTAEKRDVAVQKINHNEIVYSGNNFPVEVILNSQLYNGKEVTVTLSQNGAVKGSQTVKINSEHFLATCNFSLTAASAGVTRYVARVSVLDGEKNIINNARSFVVEVIDNKEKILLLANAPHPDISAVKEALSNSPSYEVEYGMIAEFKKPVKPYSLIIVHGSSAANQTLIEECKNQMVPFWIINPLTPDLIPGLKITGSINKFNDSEPYLNPTFGLFTISEGLSNLVKNLPAVKTVFGNYNLSNSATGLLNQKLGAVETENPILFFTEINGLKTAAFMGDGLWQWKLRDFAEHKNNIFFNEIVSKTVQYLAVKNDKSFFRLSAPKIIEENIPFEISAEVYNKSYELITDPEVSFVLTNSENKKFNYTFSKTGTSYKLNTGLLAPGDYRYEATARSNNELFVKQGFLSVSEVVSENINTRANHQVLFQLANRSSGKLFYPAQIKNLEEEILKNERIKPVTYSQISTASLIDLKWLFWLILFMFSIEWFFRKRFLAI